MKRCEVKVAFPIECVSEPRSVPKIEVCLLEDIFCYVAPNPPKKAFEEFASRMRIATCDFQVGLLFGRCSHPHPQETGAGVDDYLDTVIGVSYRS